jgi:uncharacterized protein with HEPN domain
MQRDRLLVEEMIDATTRAIELVSDVDLEQLEADRDRREALLWNFTVLGEAAMQISPELKSEHDEVAWSRPSRLRNRIVHGYWSIDLSILHTTATDDLPAFKAQLHSVLKTLDQAEPPEPEPPRDAQPPSP